MMGAVSIVSPCTIHARPKWAKRRSGSQAQGLWSSALLCFTTDHLPSPQVTVSYLNQPGNGVFLEHQRPGVSICRGFGKTPTYWPVLSKNLLALVKGL